MTQFTLPPPPAQDTPTGYAGFWRRLGAFLIDFLLFLLAAVVLAIIVKIGITVSTGSTDAATDDNSIGTFGKVMASTLFWGYMVFTHGRWGASIGKKAVGIRVFTVDGAPIGYAHAALRYSIFIVAELIGYVAAPLEDSAPAVLLVIALLKILLLAGTPIWIAAHPKKRGPHDLLAQTVVLRMG